MLTNKSKSDCGLRNEKIFTYLSFVACRCAYTNMTPNVDD